MKLKHIWLPPTKYRLSQQGMKDLEAQEKLVQACEAEFIEAGQLGTKEFISEMLGIRLPESIDIEAPKGIRNKGSGSRKRITSSRERAISKIHKKGRKCGFCGSLEPHNIRTCPNRKEAEQKKKFVCNEPGVGTFSPTDSMADG